MSQFNDRTQALRVLEAHERGYTVGLMLRRQTKSYIILTVLFAVLLVLLATLHLWLHFWFLAGIYTGCLLRDIAWIRGGLRVWWFFERVIDWDEVQRLAGRPPAGG